MHEDHLQRELCPKRFRSLRMLAVVHRPNKTLINLVIIVTLLWYIFEQFSRYECVYD